MGLGFRLRTAPPCSSTLFCQRRPKPATTTTRILCCISGPADSTSSPATPSSHSRRWYNYNSVRKKPNSLDPNVDRRWVSADFSDSSLLLSEERLTIVSYNILGDKNASNHWDLYRNVASIYLRWDYRKRVICEELLDLKPDIICLQEVDNYNDLQEVLQNTGYQGSYKRRTGTYVDGCAMFWKADKLQLLEEESIEYKQYGLRDNVAQLSVFKMCKAKSRTIIVGNIHVLYNPRRGDIKLGQIRLLLSRAHILSKKWDNAPVVLAGDYNSTPQGAIYKFFKFSELNIMLHDRGELSGQKNCRPSPALGVRRQKNSLFALMDRFLNTSWTAEEIGTATGDAQSRILTSPFKLNSSYAMVKDPSGETRDSNGEPLVTSYHSKFFGTVDYLW
ncbi:OLC1v1014260C1 [Oldenlandia corymbosa var. corymbosa]|nr:OLC1v1014260C1 [Oldenlandia corymbosa var. corymbosa]